MSMVIRVHADDATELRLLQAAKETGRSVEDLASSGVSEYMVLGFRDRPDQGPANKLPR